MAAELKFTPGDWAATCVASGGSPDNPIDLYEVGTEYARVAENCTEADARLIAQAKKLLAALQDILDTGFTRGPQGRRAWNAVRAATGKDRYDGEP